MLMVTLGAIGVNSFKARCAVILMAASSNPPHGLLARINGRLRPYGFVLYSTPASVRARWPSVLASIEIAVAVAAYWGIAFLIDSQAHLWISICIAPLVLLRSRQSIALGVKSFASDAEGNGPFENMTIGEALRKWRFWAIVGLASLTSATISYWLARLWLAHYEGESLFLRSAIIGWLSLSVSFTVVVAIFRARAEMIAMSATLAGAVAGATAGPIDAGLMTSAMVGVVAVTIALATAGLTAAFAGSRAAEGLVMVTGVATGLATVIAVWARAGTLGVAETVSLVAAFLMAPLCVVFSAMFFFLVFYPLGHLLGATLIRFWATLRYLPAGLAALPTNWSRTLFSIDFAYYPELIPGYKGLSNFNFEVLYSRVRSEFRASQGDLRRTDAHLLLFYFIPAYLYRLSIKSTFWVYWPLAYIANAAVKTRPAVLFDRLSATPFAWLSVLLSATTFIGFIIANFFAHFSKLWPSLQIAPQIAAIEFLLQLDFKSQKPWLWFSLTSATIAFCLFLWAGQMRPELKHGDIDHATRTKIHDHALWMNRLARLGRVCTILLSLSLLVYFLLWRSPLQCVLREYGPPHILALFRSYYGNYMPQGPDCRLDPFMSIFRA
jgi:hypothetical protein